jgi:hypothetical protein
MNPPNQRKSESYCTAEVEAARADWVDPDDHPKGILCRAIFSHFEPSYGPASPANNKRTPGPLTLFNALPPLEVHGTQFDDPIKNSATLHDRRSLVARASLFARSFDL